MAKRNPLTPMGTSTFTQPPKPTNVQQVKVDGTVTREQIARRAHEIYCQRIKSGIAGDAKSDWLTAEKELRSRGTR